MPESTTTREYYATKALSLYREGFSFIPESDNKQPDVQQWKSYQTEQPTEEDMKFWIDRLCAEGWLLICGTSKRLVCLDFEAAEIGIFAGIIDSYPESCRVSSPSGGWHVWLTITDMAWDDPEFPRSQKLAWRFTGEYVPAELPGAGRAKQQLLAESRGAGGYAKLVGHNRVMPDVWAPHGVTIQQYDDVCAEISAFGDDIAALTAARRAEIGAVRGDYRDDSFAAHQDIARFLYAMDTAPREYRKTTGNPSYEGGILYRAQCPVHTQDGAEHSDGSLQFGVTVAIPGRPARFVVQCHGGNCDKAEIFAAIGFGLRPGEPDNESKLTAEIEKERLRRKVRRLADEADAEEDKATVKEDVNSLRNKLLTVKKLYEVPDPEWLVKDFIVCDSLAWIVGKGDTFKSFTALDMAFCVASGRQWQGKETKQGLVIYIAAEGARGIKKRVDALEDKYGCLGTDQLLILPEPVQITSTSGKALAELCASIEPSLIVVDTQARTSVGLDEDRSKDMGVYVEALEEVKKACGASILVVHHTGWATDHMRGSSSVQFASQSVITASKSATDAMQLILTTDRQKDDEKIAPMVFNMTPRLDSLVLEPLALTTASTLDATDPYNWLTNVNSANRARAVMSYMLNNEYEVVTKSSIERAVGGKATTTRTVVTSLVSHLWLSVERVGSSDRIQLTEAGRLACPGGPHARPHARPFDHADDRLEADELTCQPRPFDLRPLGGTEGRDGGVEENSPPSHLRPVAGTSRDEQGRAVNGSLTVSDCSPGTTTDDASSDVTSPWSTLDIGQVTPLAGQDKEQDKEQDK